MVNMADKCLGCMAIFPASIVDQSKRKRICQQKRELISLVVACVYEKLHSPGLACTLCAWLIKNIDERMAGGLGSLDLLR